MEPKSTFDLVRELNYHEAVRKTNQVVVRINNAWYDKLQIKMLKEKGDGEDNVNVLVLGTCSDAYKHWLNAQNKSQIDAEVAAKEQGRYIEYAKIPERKPERVFARSKCRIPFVSRELAIEEMVKCYDHNLTIEKENSTVKPILCFSDNIYGAGKTTFGRQFLNHLKKIDLDKRINYPAAIASLKKAHHVEIDFSKSANFPYAFENVNDCVRWYVRLALAKTFKIEPADWGLVGKAEEKKAVDFCDMFDSLCSYLSEQGASKDQVFFLHFDEIGALDTIGFKKQDMELLDKFYEFWRVVCGSLIKYPLLVTGKTTELSKVGYHAVGQSPGQLFRLSLGCLQPDGIKEILSVGKKLVKTLITNTDGTTVVTKEDKTLVHILKIPEGELDKRSKDIFDLTGGIPRLLETFISFIVNEAIQKRVESVKSGTEDTWHVDDVVLERHANLAAANTPGFVNPIGRPSTPDLMKITKDTLEMERLRCLMHVLMCARQGKEVALNTVIFRASRHQFRYHDIACHFQLGWVVSNGSLDFALTVRFVVVKSWFAKLMKSALEIDAMHKFPGLADPSLVNWTMQVSALKNYLEKASLASSEFRHLFNGFDDIPESNLGCLKFELKNGHKFVSLVLDSNCLGVKHEPTWNNDSDNESSSELVSVVPTKRAIDEMDVDRGSHKPKKRAKKDPKKGNIDLIEMTMNEFIKGVGSLYRFEESSSSPDFLSAHLIRDGLSNAVVSEVIIGWAWKCYGNSGAQKNEVDAEIAKFNPFVDCLNVKKTLPTQFALFFICSSFGPELQDLFGEEENGKMVVKYELNDNPLISCYLIQAGIFFANRKGCFMALYDQAALYIRSLFREGQYSEKGCIDHFSLVRK